MPGIVRIFLVCFGRQAAEGLPTYSFFFYFFYGVFVGVPDTDELRGMPTDFSVDVLGNQPLPRLTNCEPKPMPDIVPEKLLSSKECQSVCLRINHSQIDGGKKPRTLVTWSALCYPNFCPEPKRIAEPRVVSKIW